MEDNTKKQKKIDAKKYVILKPELKEEFCESIFESFLNISEVLSVDGTVYDTSLIINHVMDENFDLFFDDLPEELLFFAEDLYEHFHSSILKTLDDNEYMLSEARVLSLQNRKLLARNMRRNRAKVALARKKAMGKKASKEVLELRAKRAARREIKKKFLHGKYYTKMTPSERLNIDKKTKNYDISKLASKMYNKVKKLDARRTKSKNFSSAFKISSNVNRSMVDKYSSHHRKTSLKRATSSAFIKEDAVDVIPASDDTLGKVRGYMPQVKLDKRFENYLKDIGVSFEISKVDPEKLNATQKNFNEDKINSLIKNINDIKDVPILISKDYYVIDGHHRWLAMKHEKMPIKVLKLSLDINDSLDVCKKYEFSDTKTVKE